MPLLFIFFNYFIYFKAHKTHETSIILKCSAFILLQECCCHEAGVHLYLLCTVTQYYVSFVVLLALQHVLHVTQRHSHIVWFPPLQRKTCCIFKAPEIGTKSKREWKTTSKKRKQLPHKPKAEWVLLHFCCCFLILLLGHHTLE